MIGQARFGKILVTCPPLISPHSELVLPSLLPLEQVGDSVKHYEDEPDCTPSAMPWPISYYLCRKLRTIIRPDMLRDSLEYEQMKQLVNSPLGSDSAVPVSPVLSGQFNDTRH